MKKILSIILILSALSVRSQEYKYCELVGFSKWFSTKITVAIDSGGGFNWDNIIKDSVDTKSVETKNEKFYVDTKERLYEGREVQRDSKGTYVWKKVEIVAKEKSFKAKTFNSMIDGMNYMGKNGWEFVQAYTITSGNANVYRWLLKKKI